MKILFFSPYSFVNVHAYPEAVVAENFRQRGHDVIQVRCKGAYSDFCISMSAIHLKPGSPVSEKQAVCAECNARREALEAQFGFETLYIDDFVSEDTIQNVQSQLKDVNQDNWTQLEYDGIPVPRYASYEYLLNEKLNTTNIETPLWDGYLTHAKNAFITADVGKKIIEQVKPDAVIAYNSAYSCNHIMCCIADQLGIPHYDLHAGSHHKHRLSQVTIFKGHRGPFLINRLEAWRRYSTRPLSIESIKKVEEHVDELIEARSDWVYTIKSANKTPEELRDFFGVDERQKVLLVTMASGDERFSASLIDALPPYREPIFNSQITWIQSLIDWVKGREDLFLLIRVHPREFPNKREKVLSRQAMQLRSVFKELPRNVKINWPDDTLSLHDIVKITDVCLNATSTAGLELLLLGVPVLIYDLEQMFSYPRELNICAESVDDYYKKIDEILIAGKSVNNIVAAFRWLSFKSCIVAIDISEAYGEIYARKPKDVASKIKGFFSRLMGRSVRPHYEDPFMNWRGLRNLNQSEWLAYAVEHGADSHIDAYCDVLISGKSESAPREHAAVRESALKYFHKLGISPPPD